MNRYATKSSGKFSRQTAGLHIAPSKEEASAFYNRLHEKCKQQPVKQPIYFKGRIVGVKVLEADRIVFERSVIFSKHFFRQFGGYGLHVELIDTLECDGFTHVRNVVDTGIVETAELPAYRLHGKSWEFHGKQLILHRSYFSNDKEGGNDLGLFSVNKPVPRTPTSQQSFTFGEV